VNLSDSARDQAARQITSSYGDKYLKPRNYETKSEGAQEAHEAIRPTYISTKETGGDNDEKRLYDLIWKRTVASQMADAELEKTIVKIGISTNDEELTAKGEVLTFDGFLKLYVESTDEEEEQQEEEMLPPMKEGQALQLAEMLATQRFTRPPSRYTEATLVRKLEELGIGRPSTYAPIISTVQKRGYVEKKSLDGWTRHYEVLRLTDGSIDKKQESGTTGADKNKLFPTDAGKLVNDFLTDYFQNVMDYNFTARIEQEFDEIAQGEKEWAKMIDSFYKPFHESVEETMEKADRVTGERELGTDPETGRPVIARMGKYGPMVQLGKTDDEEKPKFAKLREGQNIESVTLEEALDLFKLPRTLGEYEGEEVQASIGRYGPYVRHGSKFVSLGQDYDPYTINLDQAIELIEAKRKADRERTIMDFSDHDIMVYNGKYGPYIKAGKKNVKIPKDKEPKELTLEECREIIANAPAKKGKGKGGGSGKGGSKAKKKS
ncbi:MAG: DNA topoisomerase I, partial [Bacteroidetes bacterium SW_11_45_7]